LFFFILSIHGVYLNKEIAATSLFRNDNKSVIAISQLRESAAISLRCFSINLPWIFDARSPSDITEEGRPNLPKF
jgi:hypothetical protein